jgi:uncharacterized protein YjbI with pentapeptide repeats/beta-lactamase regulating signal transducer with metallopeptidase domain
MTAALASLEPVARLVVATLVNGLWQGVLIAGAVWLILRAFPRVNASTRYAAWSLALLAVVIVPIVTTLPRVSSVLPQSSGRSVAANLPKRLDAKGTYPTSAYHALASRPASAQAAPSPVLPQPAHLSVPGAPTVILFTLWSLAALVILVRLGIALVRLEKLKNNALPLGVEYRDAMHRWLSASKGSRDVRICVSDTIDVPVAVGLFDSMILLPRQLLDRLETQEIDQISLHELAHLRRADDWSNGVQRLAQAFLFFNPAIAFIARQMDLEREVACDDWVLSLTGDVRPYAFCLTKMAEVTAWPHRALAAPGVFVTRKSISIRIERLLAVRRAIDSALAPGASAAVLAVVLAIVFVVQMVTPSIAFTGNQIVSATPATAHAAIAARSASTTARAVKKPERAKVTIPPAYVAIAPVHVAIAPIRIAAATSASKNASIAMSHFPVAIVSSVVRDAMVRAAMVLADGVSDCTGCDFRGSKLANHDFSHAKLLGADFRGADLRSANFRGAVLTGVDLRNANLSDASFAHANLEGCDLRGAIVTGADFTDASLTGCSLDMSAMSAAQAALMLGECTGCDLAHANLRGRDLRGIQLEGVDLAHADLRDADLRNAQLTGVDLSYARLDGARLDGASLTGCELHGVDLRHVDLSHVSLIGTSMSGTDMK